jgi:serine protease
VFNLSIARFTLFISMIVMQANLVASGFIVTYSGEEFIKSNYHREKRILIKAGSKNEAMRIAYDRGVDVISVTPNMQLYPVYTNDSFSYSQWPLYESAGGIELADAWLETTGHADTVVAVIDTGILPHEDLSGRILRGADLISDPEVARDGDGRDLNPFDEGDYVLADDLCPGSFSVSDSSWHGTHVAGTIAANTNNKIGIAGIDLKAKILPIRALGKCGGSLLDVADGIRWAAGGVVSDLPVNANRAHVINLSLGAFGACNETMQSAINFANAQGSVVVVAAGNDELNMDWLPFIPATCNGVITVGAANRSGTFAWYSNRGDAIDITAPGGDGARGNVISLSNQGTLGPAADDYRGLMGTSMATPHVSGVAALIRAINPSLYPAQVEDVIKRSYKGLSCPRDQCGAGLLDAYSAVLLAKGMPADESFRAYEPITSGPANSDEDRSSLFPLEEQESSGACGSVVLVNGSDGPGGPGPFILCFLLGAFLINLTKKVEITST